MKIALIISSLSRGGAEGVLSRLANGLVSRGHEVVLITLSSAQPDYALNQAIRWVPMGTVSASTGLFQAVVRNIRRIRFLRCTVQDIAPDVVVSFMDTTNILTLLAFGRKYPVIVSERIHPAQHNIGRIWSGLRERVYPKARCVVVQTQAARDFFSPSIQKMVRVIPNAVQAVSVPIVAPSIQDRHSLIAMGRLDRQKGFDLLLNAFADLDGFDEWKLTIYGEGKERFALEALRDELDLAGRVFFPGHVDDPQTALAAGTLFVLSSRFEGFPNALTEAMACGLPVIATDCLSGPSDIIRHEEDGYLVPANDVSALTRGLEICMSDEQFRRRLGENAREVASRFSEEEILDMWEVCLVSATNTNSGKD